ncbi:DUF4123 domain-containing protein [Stenotrophomonas rhizophila]|uniref:DUF4123 domain-containing protein n=1 Tax=Stenotrophomonas rhizophila TaxID=216778 RepID=UPI002A6A0045|nr:DUF4123 domain-containing protein [Stenotrophomonas rhizophila]MDY0955813.1 DUF4123 domain-containing protein [Stenotrophomonas rhizophila]
MIRRYAIIDSSQRPHFHERLTRWGVRYRSLFDGHAESSLTDIAPLLVEYPESDPNLRLEAEIAQLAAAKPAVSLWWSALEPELLARHFHAFHLIKVPEKGGREMLLRWYDTRVLPELLRVLTPAQRFAFLSGVERLEYYDRFGDSQSWLLPELEAKELPALTPLQLSDAQYAALLDACEPDVAIAQLRRVIPDEMRRLPYRALHPFVMHHMKETVAHGVDQVDDHVQYLLLALYTSGGCRAHPAVEARLSRSGNDHAVAFADWVTDLPDDVWSTGAPLWETLTTGSVGVPTQRRPPHDRS